MTLHKEALSTIIYTLVGSLLILVLIYYFVPILTIPAIVLAVVFMLFILSFFRVPKRNFTLDKNCLVAPCDGKVVVIEEVLEDEFIKGKCKQISIFMSPLNVHINWHPLNARVTYLKHHPGKYLVAWNPKSSTDNERMSVGYLHNSSRVVVRQIAGFMARRIKNYAVEDVPVEQGTELGFIKFGSRVDVFIPAHWEVEVKMDDKTVGGVTRLAKIP